MSRSGWLLALDGITPYAEAWELQKTLVAGRQAGRVGDGLIVLEHEPVYTVGRATKTEHLLFPRETLLARGFGVYDIERGGSITYHGPRQLVGYPILDLRAYGDDVVGYVRALEETVLRTLQAFGIAADRRSGFPGVWVGEEKIAAVGVAVKRKVTMHGVALNVDPDLSHFGLINPCGLGKRVTSMARVLGQPVALDEVRPVYVAHFSDVYGLRLEQLGRHELAARVNAGGPSPVASS